MRELKTTRDYKNIVINNLKLIDVRASIEYDKGAFLNSINMPILSNEERHLIGICYKEKGNEEATKLGYNIVSGKIKEERVRKWVEYFNENKDAIIYCFRGGSRSTIAQKWIYEECGREIVKLEGGYKAFRNFLIEELEPENIKSKPLIITGYTGSGKTILLNKINNSIDLEGIANHRGSTFGHFTTPQPTQINFENNLAYNIIRHSEKNYKYMILEDEGKNVGKNFIPVNLYNYFQSGDLVVLDIKFDERVNNILQGYVIDGQKQHINLYDDELEGLDSWFNDMKSSMERVKNKIGGDRFKIVIDEFHRAYEVQNISGKYDSHRTWIELFLSNYYDPMYKHSIGKLNRHIVFKGNEEEVLQYLKHIEK